MTFLQFGFSFEDLHKVEGLERLDQVFLSDLEKADPPLANRLKQARSSLPSSLEESALLLDLGPYVEDFIGKLFTVEKEILALQESTHQLAPLYRCKRHFIQRVAAKAFTREEALLFNGPKLKAELELFLKKPYSDLVFASYVLKAMEETKAHFLNIATQYAAWAMHQEKPSALFRLPRKIDPEALFPFHNNDGKITATTHTLRKGFDCTTRNVTPEDALDQAHYCIFCHDREKDSCSKGLSESAQGCPLDQKISEMNILRSQGYVVGALAMIMVDNPMVATTGNRICNDCKKACIFQKQAPVDIPSIETETLDRVLNLPWGVEIYALLSRWNPLNLRRYIPQKESGYKVLIAGMGPAGFTLAHYLLNEGHTIVGIDGLKIEPLEPYLLSQPIRDWQSLRKPLSQRTPSGFGGVVEYGITARWDKNYLTLVRVLLERRSHFALYDGVRLGGTITIPQAFELGFDHIALCLGAGSPKSLDLPQGLAPGIRLASDFLMALQLTGVAQENSLANYQLRLPLLVVGGGLTAIDTATEALAYYPLQVEKFLKRFEESGSLPPSLSKEESCIAEEFLNHAQALRKGDTSFLENACTVVYRNRLQDSPGYRLNAEEVHHALQEGVQFLEKATPLEIKLDESGHIKALIVKAEDGVKTISCRTLLVATGTSPNRILEQEDATLKMEGDGFLLSYEGEERLSYFGDLHRNYQGSVVKAMASAKKGYPEICKALKKREIKNDCMSSGHKLFALDCLAPLAMTIEANRDTTPSSSSHLTQYVIASGAKQSSTKTQDLQTCNYFHHLDSLLKPRVEAVHRLTPSIVEIVISAPQATRNFQPGQFFRLQNYGIPSMEGLALTGAKMDPENGLISLIVLETGGSSSLCQYLKPRDRVVLMGPTGTPTEIPSGETVLLIGGGLGNAVLFSIGQALREKGNRVLYVAGYKKPGDRFKVEEIEVVSDHVVWCYESAPKAPPHRPQDFVYEGNVIEGLLAYATSSPSLPLEDVTRIITIGSDTMMAAVAFARKTLLKPYLNPTHVGIGSINSPMQCMMKEICGQCIQTVIDPITGATRVVFSCAAQDQDLDAIDFTVLQGRLQQNSLLEKQTTEWVKRCINE